MVQHGALTAGKKKPKKQRSDNTQANPGHFVHNLNAWLHSLKQETFLRALSHTMRGVSLSRGRFISLGHCVQLAVTSSVSGLLLRLVNEIKVQRRGAHFTYKSIQVSVAPEPVSPALSATTGLVMRDTRLLVLQCHTKLAGLIQFLSTVSDREHFKIKHRLHSFFFTEQVNLLRVLPIAGHSWLQ